MPRGGNKKIVGVAECQKCKEGGKRQQNRRFIISKDHKTLELNMYCPKDRAHTKHSIREESAGSKGLARNK